MDEMNEYTTDIVTIEDDEGNTHTFEILDAIETDDARYIALIPVFENPEDMLESDCELIVLEVLEEDGNEILAPIEDDQLFDEIAGIFEERLEELYDIEELEEQ